MSEKISLDSSEIKYFKFISANICKKYYFSKG